MAELVTAGLVLITLLLLAPLIGLLPEPTLGALVLVAAAGLIKPVEFQAIANIRRVEFWWAIIAMVGVILLGTLQGILVAVAISVLNLLYFANHPPVYALGRKPGTDVFRPLSTDHPGDETFPGLLMIRTEGRMHFASAARAGDKLRKLVDESKPRVLAVDFSAVPDIEYTALKMLTELEARLAEHNISLWLVALNPEPLKVVQSSELGKTLGHERMFFNLEQVVETYLLQDENDHRHKR